MTDRTVVVTGASSGIGHATVRRFARKGARIVAAARRGDALAELERRTQSSKGSIVPMPADVTDVAAMNELARRATEAFGRIDVWVNNAAVTAFARIEDLPIEDYERVWKVNVMGYVNGIRAALPYMREEGRGVIINVSSVVGRAGQPYATAYTMTKHAIRALGIGLRQELMLEGMKGIHVCTVMPGSIDTPLFQNGANYTGWRVKPMSPVYPPDKVAKAIVSCVRRPRPEVFVGGAARAMNVQSHLMPRRAERSLARRVDRDHFDKRLYSGPGTGNLYEPARSGAAESGGWGGAKGLNMRRASLGAGALAALWMISARAK